MHVEVRDFVMNTWKLLPLKIGSTHTKGEVIWQYFLLNFQSRKTIQKLTKLVEVIVCNRDSVYCF